MADDNNINNLSDEEKLLTFYTKSILILQKVVDDGGKTFSMVDQLDLPYHVFNWWRLLVEDIDALFSLISELIEGKGLKGLHIQEFEQFSAKRKLLMFYSEYRTKFGMWKFYGQWLLNWLEERTELNLPLN